MMETIGMSFLIRVMLLLSVMLNIVLLINQKRIMKKNRLKRRKTSKHHDTDVVIVKKVDETPEKSQPDVTEENHTEEKTRVRKATEIANEKWELYGMSIQGEGHIQSDLPCQDFHSIEVLDTEKGVGVAVVSDGAGSKSNSDKGSQFVCEQTILHLKEAILKLGWTAENYPCPASWNKVCRLIVQLIQNDLFEFAEKNQCSFDSLGATWMMLFYTPEKTYFAHIGDGRAGVLTQDGWKTILIPHKGEEANQTVFITNKVLEEGLEISGVEVPETIVIDEPINAFVLMSDGCEAGLWMKNKKEILPDGDYRYVQLNMPFTPALDDILMKMQKCERSQRKELLFNIIDRYNKPLKNETDDKTICLGYVI